MRASCRFFQHSVIGFSLLGLAAARAETPVGEKPRRLAVVLPFAVAGQAGGVETSVKACPEVRDPGTKLQADDAAKLVETISAELKKKLEKKMDARLASRTDDLAEGTLVFAGCLTTIDAGNAAERMAGFNLGASRLAAHVVILKSSKEGLTPVTDLTVAVKGANLLPPLGPIGLVTHAVREYKQTLDAEAKKLADHILKEMAEKMKKEAKERGK
jgi:hypothetical protein